VALLPADQAEVVLLRVVGGFDVAEVAVLVGRRPGHVRVLQHRGLRRLAQLLPDGAVTPGAPPAI
jgi:RNA polymerase sigma-70 factor (ECF subfamily)